MELELEATGIHIVCCSQLRAQTTINWGARLIEPSQPELRQAPEAEDVRNEAASGRL
jgi:hypothetical protein